MAKLQDGTRIYGTLNVNSAIFIGTTNVLPTLTAAFLQANLSIGAIVTSNTNVAAHGVVLTTHNNSILAAFTQANAAIGAITTANNNITSAFLKANAALTTLTFDTINATRYIVFANNTTGTFTQANVDSGLTFNPSSNVMTLGTGAMLGIGLTSTPSANLHLTGNTYITTALGVGTPASAVTGEIRAANNITAYYSSDRRLKENIIKIRNSLDKVSLINGVEFDWTDDYLKDQGHEDGYFVRKHDVGVIAQEVREVLPEVVGERQDGMLAVKYDRIIPLLIEAIKELKREVEELKAR